jgi:hypothetical protein
MTVFTGTVQTFAMIGIREDLSDVIANIAPLDTPFYSMVKKGKAKNRTPEFIRDTLASANANNASIEGDDITTGKSILTPDRLKTIVQLFAQAVVVSDTARAVDAAGRADELKYQVAKGAKEIKRDIESRLTGNYASVLGNATTAGQSPSVEAWLVTNTSYGAGGSSGGYSGGLVSAATDGTQRTATEALMKAQIKNAWNQGGDPEIIMVGPTQKQNISAFSGIATQYRQNYGVKQATILGAAGVYVSDFGDHKIIPNRFCRDRTQLILDMTKWQVKFLQPFAVLPLARTGHAEKRLLKAELGLCCLEERASAKVADLT